MSTLQNKIIKSIKSNILQLSHKAKSSHIGGCLSIVDILVVLFNSILRKKSGKKFKDSFILSKGHACLALYCTLFEKGILNKVKNENPEIIEKIESTGKLEDETEKILVQCIEEYKKDKKNA